MPPQELSAAGPGLSTGNLRADHNYLPVDLREAALEGLQAVQLFAAPGPPTLAGRFLAA